MSRRQRLTAWLYRWLPIIFGCHCRDDRSFHYRGRKFPICARCTGELAGILAALGSGAFYLPPALLCALLMAPMVADGTVQLLTAYRSTNPRRLVTGLLFGYALGALFLISSIAAYRFGFELASAIG